MTELTVAIVTDKVDKVSKTTCGLQRLSAATIEQAENTPYSWHCDSWDLTVVQESSVKWRCTTCSYWGRLWWPGVLGCDSGRG